MFKKLLGKVWYLHKTGAPLDAYVHYYIGRVKNRKIKRMYQESKDKFIEVKKSLDVRDDWFTPNVAFWNSVFDEYHFHQKSEIQALEVGSYQGLSSFFTLWTLPNAKITCVDTWGGSDEHQAGIDSQKNLMQLIENSFDSNLSVFNDRVTKFKGTSFRFFLDHADYQEKYDLIYIDGSHFADDVAVDAIKAFDMLKIGGLMIFDDYWWQYYKDVRNNTATGVNAFLNLKKGLYQIVRMYGQITIIKLISSDHSPQ